jgi:hypothetical protein
MNLISFSSFYFMLPSFTQSGHAPYFLPGASGIPHESCPRPSGTEPENGQPSYMQTSPFPLKHQSGILQQNAVNYRTSQQNGAIQFQKTSMP